MTRLAAVPTIRLPPASWVHWPNRPIADNRSGRRRRMVLIHVDVVQAGESLVDRAGASDFFKHIRHLNGAQFPIT